MRHARGLTICPNRSAAIGADNAPGTRGMTMSKFVKLIRSSKGATAIEYGLLAALISVAAIAALTNVGTKLGSTFNNASNKL